MTQFEIPDVYAVPDDAHPGQSIVDLTEEYVHRDGWDQPTRLFYARNVPGLGAGVGEFHLGPTAALHAGDILRTIGGAIIRLSVPMDCVGWIAVYEAWEVVADQSDAAAVAAIIAQAEARRLYRHPDRVSIRIAYGGFVDGTMAVRFRRELDDEIVPDRPLGDGRIADAMRDLISVTRAKYTP